MYIVALAWLYVVLMMALTEPSFIGGVMTFLMYGLAPLALFLWLMGTKHRKRMKYRAAQQAALAQQAGEQGVTTPPNKPETPSAP